MAKISHDVHHQIRAVARTDDDKRIRVGKVNLKSSGQSTVSIDPKNTPPSAARAAPTTQTSSRWGEPSLR